MRSSGEHCDGGIGGEIEIPTLNGRLKLKIPAESQSGKLFRLKGKGIASCAWPWDRRSSVSFGRRNAGSFNQATTSMFAGVSNDD